LNNRGNALGNLGLYDEALKDYTRALELRPDFSEALCNRGITLTHLKHYEEALKDYTCSLELRPDDASTLYNRGIVLARLKRYEEALKDYTCSLELRPDDPRTLNNRGVALGNLGLYDEALKDFTRSLELRPDDTGTQNNRGIVFADLGLYDEALKDYNRALELLPDFPEALNNRGATFYSLKRYDEALKDYNRTLELRPDDPDALYNCGEVLYQRVRKFKLGWRYKPAVDSFREALKVAPEYSEALNGLGVSLLKLKKYDDAVGAFCQAVELARKQDDKKNEALFRYKLAVAYCRRNQRERAKRELIASLNLKPDFDAAQKAFDALTSDSRVPWWKWWFGGPASCTCWCKRIVGALLIVALLALIAMPLVYFFNGKPSLDWHYYLALLFVVLFFLFMPSIKFLNAFGVGVDIEPQTSPMSTLEPQLSLEASSDVYKVSPRQDKDASIGSAVARPTDVDAANRSN
jgi:tetratricopeptide (TPR) repeat protein